MANSAEGLAGFDLDSGEAVRQAQGMKRTLSLSFVALTFAALPALAQSSADIGRQLNEKWIACVRSHNSAALRVGAPSAEESFRACDTEEQLYLAAAAASLSDPGSVNRVRFQHFSNRNALKLELNNAIFKEMTKRIGKE